MEKWTGKPEENKNDTPHRLPYQYLPVCNKYLTLPTDRPHRRVSDDAHTRCAATFWKSGRKPERRGKSEEKEVSLTKRTPLTSYLSGAGISYWTELSSTVSIALLGLN